MTNFVVWKISQKNKIPRKMILIYNRLYSIKLIIKMLFVKVNGHKVRARGDVWNWL